LHPVSVKGDVTVDMSKVPASLLLQMNFPEVASNLNFSYGLEQVQISAIVSSRSAFSIYPMQISGFPVY